MTEQGAHTAVTTSAVIVGAVYAYRRLFEGSGQTGATVASKNSVKQLAGSGPPPPLSHWIVGYGFAFLVISAIAQADPNLGGGFALLVMLGTVLTQGQQMLADLNGQLGGGSSAASAAQAYAIGQGINQPGTGLASGVSSAIKDVSGSTVMQSGPATGNPRPSGPNVAGGTRT